MPSKGKNAVRREWRAQRRERNRALDAARPDRTPAEQRARLDDRLGVGVGAVKERKKLREREARRRAG